MKDRKHNTHKFKFLNSHFSPCIFTPYTGSIRHQRDRIAIPGSQGTRFSLFSSEKLRVFLSELSSEEQSWQYCHSYNSSLKSWSLAVVPIGFLKSDNLQYNTLVRWADGTNNSSTKCLMFQTNCKKIYSTRNIRSLVVCPSEPAYYIED